MMIYIAYVSLVLGIILFILGCTFSIGPTFGLFVFDLLWGVVTGSPSWSGESGTKKTKKPSKKGIPIKFRIIGLLMLLLGIKVIHESAKLIWN